jgi:hypothetical protein
VPRHRQVERTHVAVDALHQGIPNLGVGPRTDALLFVR